MFRVLARIGVFNLFVLLIFTSYGYKVILEKNKNYKLIIVLLFLISLLEFYVPLRITFNTGIPNTISYIKDNIQQNDILAIYPSSKSREMLYWLTEYKKRFANPKDYVSLDGTFVSSKFTKELTTSQGLEYAKNRGIKYIVVFEDDITITDKNFFRNNITLESVFQNNEKFNL